MKLRDLYIRVEETLGLQVITADSLVTVVANCFGDLTSRGYREFDEVETYDFLNLREGRIVVDAPKDLRKTLYVKVNFGNRFVKALRIPLTHDAIDSSVKNNKARTDLLQFNKNVLFYIKKDKIYIDYNDYVGNPTSVTIGYNKSLKPPKLDESLSEQEKLDQEISIREEFEEALVFYACFFYHRRDLNNEQTTHSYYNTYKYFLEDILSELKHEDMFNEEGIIEVHE